MLRYLLVSILACFVSVCVYAHNQDHLVFNRNVYHGHPTQNCYGKIWADCFQNGWIMKNHDPIDQAEVALLNGGATGIKDHHEHSNASRINANQKSKRSHAYYDQHRQFYCTDYKDGGPKPSQRHFHSPVLPEPEAQVCEVVEAPAAPKLIKVTPKRKLTIIWASLKKSRL